jgi:hypothetical protein
MLFWIFVIIAAIALIGLCIIPIIPTPYNKWKPLDKECDKLWSLRCRIPYHDPRYKAICDECDKADTQRREFEKAHPNYRKTKERLEVLTNICVGFLIGAGVVLLIMGLVLTITYLSAPANRAALEAEYEVLSWEVANDVYTDSGDDVVGKKELYNHVREWNKNLASNQAGERNFWYGIFVPNIYGDLNPIELK